MTLRKLSIFLEVAKEKNMTRASKTMHISQPAISQIIKELEGEYRVKLLERIGKKLYLTDEGELLSNYARRILNLYGEFEEKVEDGKKLKRGKLRIGASTTIGIYIMPQLIKAFKEKYPFIDVNISVENTEHIANMLINNEIDIAFVEGNLNIDELESEFIWIDELVFIASKNHKWNKREKLSKKDIEEAEFILREIGSGTRQIFEEKLKQERYKINNILTLGNTEAIKKIVEEDMGVSCISKLTVEEEIKKGSLIEKRAKFNITREFKYVYHKDKFFSNLLMIFLEFAIEYKN